jgi:hypothetical protein
MMIEGRDESDEEAFLSHELDWDSLKEADAHRTDLPTNADYMRRDGVTKGKNHFPRRANIKDLIREASLLESNHYLTS